jgi:hypothetical protein
VRFAPLPLCLSAQGPRWTDPTIAPAFDGLKIPVSRRVTFSDRSLLRSFIPWTPQQGVQPASQPAGISAVPHSQRVTGRSSAIY